MRTISIRNVRQKMLLLELRSPSGAGASFLAMIAAWGKREKGKSAAGFLLRNLCRASGGNPVMHPILTPYVRPG